MAATAISPVKMSRNVACTLPATVAIDAADGALIDLTGAADHRTLLLLEAASAATATLHKGDNIQGAQDLAVEIPANGRICLTVESMRFTGRTGPNRGKLRITGAGVKAACVALP